MPPPSANPPIWQITGLPRRSTFDIEPLPAARGLERLHRAHPVELGDVGAGHERLGARALEHHHAHRVVVPGLLERRVSSEMVSWFSALSLSGRLIVIVRTLPASSVSRLRKAMSGSIRVETQF
jgi:hypothetical protein